MKQLIWAVGYSKLYLGSIDVASSEYDINMIVVSVRHGCVGHVQVSRYHRSLPILLAFLDSVFLFNLKNLVSQCSLLLPIKDHIFSSLSFYISLSLSVYTMLRLHYLCLKIFCWLFFDFGSWSVSLTKPILQSYRIRSHMSFFSCCFIKSGRFSYWMHFTL